VNEKFEAIKNEYNYEKMKMLVYNEDSVVEGIRDLSLKRDIDVVAMMTHGRTGMARLFRDSIAEDVSATVKTPLLAFHHEMQERA
jgi:nucleotide-binding universal stress UspA family protein